MKKILVALLVIFISPQADAELQECPPSPAALLVHGLNNTADIMIPWGDTLREAGIHPIFVTLAGHSKDSSLSGVRHLQWIEDIQSAYQTFRTCNPNGKLFGVGYSLGGLTLTAFLNRERNARFDALYLIAPAIKLSARSQSLAVFSPLRSLGVSLPSLAPRHIRVHDWTPIQTYAELGELVDEVRHLSRIDLGNLPVLILISPRDELVNRMRLSRWLELNKLYRWEISPLTPKFKGSMPYYHLSADRHSLTEESFELASREMVVLFQGLASK